MSILGADGVDWKLIGAQVCSAATASEPLASDALEGNFGKPPYGIAVNGVGEHRPDVDRAGEVEEQNVVVETDVPAESASPSALILSAGGVLAGAGALTVIRRRALAKR